MSGIEKYLNTTVIRNLVKDFIWEGYTSYDDLDDASQNRLISACIKSVGKEAYFSIVESDNVDTTLHHFSEYLVSYDEDEVVELLNSMRKSATEYFKDDLNNLFLEEINIAGCDRYWAGGFSIHQDNENGELTWRKI